ncbi:MAG: DNA-directed RNA polymerase subunit omega [Acidobacteria bacterium]|nr:DNA-directed RNA polymerase subunit omega [Acidobacteriota bacterium]
MNRIENLESKFRFVHAAARRARQLQSGSRPLLPTVTRKPTCIAMEEVLGGAVTYRNAAETTEASVRK